DQYHGQRNRDQIRRRPLSSMREVHAEYDGTNDQEQDQNGRTADARQGRQVLYDPRVDDQKHRRRDEAGQHDPAPPLEIAPFRLVDLRKEEDQCDKENGEQVQQVHADGEAEQIGNQDEVTVGTQSKRILTSRQERRLLSSFF